MTVLTEKYIFFNITKNIICIQQQPREAQILRRDIKPYFSLLSNLKVALRQPPTATINSIRNIQKIYPFPIPSNNFFKLALK